MIRTIQRAALAAALLLWAPGALGATVAPGLLDWLRENSNESSRADVIVQLSSPLDDRETDLLLGDATQVKFLPELRMFAARVPARQIPRLASHSKVSVISPDRAVRAHGRFSDLQATSGASEVMATHGARGRGVAIAILDSGVASRHDLAITRSVSVVPGHAAIDDNGHGTFVAGVAAGTGSLARGGKGRFAGVAPAASIVSVKVLDDRGRGHTSWVLAGIDWVLANHRALGIRIVNLSLGSPSSESHVTDPLCQATRRLHEADLLTVVSAGNQGRTADGEAAFGTISTPGNSPWVLTVGAADGRGTRERSDDQVAAFSSRGPSRSFDVTSEKHDHLVKPEVVAPGVGIVAAALPPPSTTEADPASGASKKPVRNPHYAALSGTSAAAAAVSGAAALMLEANPLLGPSHLKAIIAFSSETLIGPNLFEQGAGLLNVEGAIRMAKVLRGAEGPELLSAELMPEPYSVIGGELIPWSAGSVVIERTVSSTQYSVLPSGELLTMVSSGKEPLLAGGLLLVDDLLLGPGVYEVNGIEFANGLVYRGGLLYADREPFEAAGLLPFEPRPSVSADGAFDASGISLHEAVLAGAGTLALNNGELTGRRAFMVDGVIFSSDSTGGSTGASRSAFTSSATLGEAAFFASGSLIEAGSTGDSGDRPAPEVAVESAR